jgi:predicted transcriptional regulator
MTLAEIIQLLNLTLLTDENNFSQVTPQGAYAADLLSCVMAGAPFGGIWITLQAHSNIVAVAALREQAAVIISEGAQPDEATIARANLENIPLFSTPESTYTIAGKLWELGIH